MIEPTQKFTVYPKDVLVFNSDDFPFPDLDTSFEEWPEAQLRKEFPDNVFIFVPSGQIGHLSRDEAIEALKALTA